MAATLGSAGAAAVAEAESVTGTAGAAAGVCVPKKAGSCHGPSSLSSQPPVQLHVPPNCVGRFSAGICFRSSD